MPAASIKPVWAAAPINTCPVVRPLFFFFYRNSGEPDLVTVDHEPSADFEGVTDFELNDFNWQGSAREGPWADGYAAFDLDGQVLKLRPRQHG